MKVAVQQDDLQLLTKTLQELFLAEVPFGGAFQVKCAVNNDELMILIQHPAGLTVDTQTVFQVLEDAIQSLLSHRHEHVQCFLRVLGEKRPYTKRALYINQRVEIEDINSYSPPPASVGQESGDNSFDNKLIFPSFGDSIPGATNDRADSPLTPPVSTNSFKDEGDSPFAASVSKATFGDEGDSPFAPPVSPPSFSDEMDSAFAPPTSTSSFNNEIDSTFVPYSSTSAFSDEVEEEPFDPFAGAPNLLPEKPKKPIKLILLGVACVGTLVLGSGIYFLTNPCILSECQAIQTADQLKTESRRLMRQAKSEQQLVTLQHQLNASSAELAQIPFWSVNNAKIEELRASLSGSAEKIDQVVKALQAGELATRKTQTPSGNLEELQGRQKLWRRAIAPLEAIAANSELYTLAQVKLLSYRAGLNGVNQQLLVAEKWLKKLNAAQAVANAATQQETAIKSLKDLQKVQSTWQVAVNALNIIPPSSSEYQQAQELLKEYKPKLAAARNRTTKEQLAAKTYQQAINAAKQAKAFEQKQQWQAAVAQWELALQSAKQISDNSFQYRQAQALIEPYSATLKQAKVKLEVANNLQKTRTDLNKVCTQGMRICTFTINNQEITVQLSREYDQARQSNIPANNSGNPNMITNGNQHLEILQQALGVISDNANMSLAIYDSQGRPVYKRSLEG
ncbi:hypothetical protein H6G41_08800 [Tolypothrix sp. FACHB-123]|uniref:hypothetical protein n=1 Tax=Tolypothrix sp. FACHB-123 TaxID=2692868 RepID=UPI00168994BD|nr:hypothetical protein [Tolypothrix sp. FACHB-123]MBD2354726.1 hypothetical protein [Tolypothrix sp. FACHB-123]